MLLHKLFKEIVLFDGPENIMHIVTDNSSNYFNAHCINLIFQDISNLQSIYSVVNHASKYYKVYL